MLTFICSWHPYNYNPRLCARRLLGSKLRTYPQSVLPRPSEECDRTMRISKHKHGNRDINGDRSMAMLQFAM